LRRTVVMVAVETRERVLIASGVRDIEHRTPGADGAADAHLAGHGHRVKGCCGFRMERPCDNRAITAAYRDHTD
jgi:hypothetical protein